MDGHIPADPSHAEQRDALRKGLGRSVLWAISGRLDEGLLLDACLHDLCYDRDVSDLRGEWLWRCITAAGCAERFRDPVLRALRALNDPLAADQLCGLGVQYAVRGDSAFRDRFREIVETPPFADLPLLGEDELLILEPEDAFRRIARRRDRELSQREWDWHDRMFVEIAASRLGEEGVRDLMHGFARASTSRLYQGWQDEQLLRQVPATPAQRRWPGLPSTVAELLAAAQSHVAPAGMFRAWGRHASDDDLSSVLNVLITEDSPRVIARLLCVFGKRELPRIPETLVEWWQHEDPEVRRRTGAALGATTHPRIRELALQSLKAGSVDAACVGLFINNFQPGDDDLIADALILPGDERQRHDLLFAVNEMLETNPAASVLRLAELVYLSTPCENCRFFAVRMLHTRDAIPQWMRQECMHDSAGDCRQLAESTRQAE